MFFVTVIVNYVEYIKVKIADHYPANINYFSQLKKVLTFKL